MIKKQQQLTQKTTNNKQNKRKETRGYVKEQEPMGRRAAQQCIEDMNKNTLARWACLIDGIGLLDFGERVTGKTVDIGSDHISAKLIEFIDNREDDVAAGIFEPSTMHKNTFVDQSGNCDVYLWDEQTTNLIKQNN